MAKVAAGVSLETSAACRGLAARPRSEAGRLRSSATTHEQIQREADEKSSKGQKQQGSDDVVLRW